MDAFHLDNLVRRAPALAACQASIETAFEMMRDCFTAGGKLLLCGNGGSACDAEHWAAELLKGFCHKRPLSPQQSANLPAHIASRLQNALPAIALTNFPGLGSAFANDVAPELIYAQLVWALGRPGDVLVGISTSGQAGNVCAAVETARARGLRTIALTGESGGKLASLCDLAICAPGAETYLIQEHHLPIYHCLSLMLEDAFFADHGGEACQ